jgi:hypothetical protein
VRSATYPDTPYLIIGLKAEARLAAWQIRYGEVIPVSLHIGLNPPVPQAGAKLTKAQKNAILLSALIAFILVIVISLTLLPSAPSVP